MNIAKMRYGALVVGLALVFFALAPGGGRSVLAAALTPTAEPPTPSNTPAPTDTPVPTSTPVAPAVTSTPGAQPPAATATAPASSQGSQRGKPDLEIFKSVNKNPASVGDEVQFTIRVTNRGSHAADDVVVTDAVPDAFDVMQAITTRGLVSHNGQTVKVAIGTMREGDEVTITIRARVSNRALPGDVTNGASVSTTSSGDNPANNTSSATLTIIVPALVTATPSVATPALAPTLAPTAAPAPIPAKLPRTGDASTGQPAALLALGLGLIALSLLLRRKARL